MPLDHLGLGVSNIEEAKAFYLATLKPLGYTVLMSFLDGKVLGLGTDGKPDFWLTERKPGPGDDIPRNTTHLAFSTTSRATVDAFHAAALEAGAKDNGKPGVRAHYHPNYYGAFVLDLEGRNIEVVCHLPEA